VPELFAVLRDLGIHNLSPVTSLSRGDLMDRLGPDAARLWERAAGRATFRALVSTSSRIYFGGARSKERSS